MNSPRILRRTLLVVLLLGFTLPAAAQAGLVLGPSGKPFSCPDPSVYEHTLVCTSDHQANAFPIYRTSDLQHWRLTGYVLPAGHQPWWALHSPEGKYWAPDITHIGDNWVVYFSAQFNSSLIGLRYNDGFPLQPATLVIGVAWAQTLAGPWNTTLVHYPDQCRRFNPQRPGVCAGVIDPGVVRDPITGRRYLFWAEQPSTIWAAALSPNGLATSGAVHLVLWAKRHNWDCDHKGICRVEGPAPFFHKGKFILLYSGASTWDGSYAMGAAVSTNPLRPFRRMGTQPILRSGNGWIAPGGGQVPVSGPYGQQELFYHALLGPDSTGKSDERLLLEGRFHWQNGIPLVNNGLAG